MRKTTNYALNQWDETDRILRTDFNRDNERIAVGRKEMKSAKSALQLQVRNHSSFQLLRTVTTTHEAHQVDLKISGINWGNYQTVVLEIINASTGFGSGRLRLNNFGNRVSIGSSIVPVEFQGVTLVYLPVLHRPERRVFSISQEEDVGFRYNRPVEQDVITLNLVGNHQRYYTGKGTVINIWGVR